MNRCGFGDWRQTAAAIEHQTNMQESATHTMSVVEEGTTLLEELKIQSAKTGDRCGDENSGIIFS